MRVTNRVEFEHAFDRNRDRAAFDRDDRLPNGAAESVHEHTVAGLHASGAYHHLVRGHPFVDPRDRLLRIGGTGTATTQASGTFASSACPSYTVKHATRAPISKRVLPAPFARTVPTMLLRVATRTFSCAVTLEMPHVQFSHSAQSVLGE